MAIKWKYAWFPMIVKTWRPRGSKALIWMQKYRIQNGERSCNYLGFFSKEIIK